MSKLAKQLDPSMILIKAFVKAISFLGFTKAQGADVLGVSRATLDRHLKNGFDMNSREAEFAKLFIRIYRSLFAITGGDTKLMEHFMNSPNRALSGQPKELLFSVQGIVRVNDYLDAMRGKV